MLQNWLKSHKRVTAKASYRKDTKYHPVFGKSHRYLRAGPQTELGSPRPKVGLCHSTGQRPHSLPRLDTGLVLQKPHQNSLTQWLNCESPQKIACRTLNKDFNKDRECLSSAFYVLPCGHSIPKQLSCHLSPPQQSNPPGNAPRQQPSPASEDKAQGILEDTGNNFCIRQNGEENVEVAILFLSQAWDLMAGAGSLPEACLEGGGMECTATTIQGAGNS